MTPARAATTRSNWRTSGGRLSWDLLGAGCSGGTAGNVGISSQSMDIRACNAAGSCSPWSNNVTFQPVRPDQGVEASASTHDDNSITFTWNTPAYNGNAIQGYRSAATTTDLRARTESYTFSGLGSRQTRTIR